MRVTIAPGALRGEAVAVPSKSAAHRHLICAALSDRETFIRLRAVNQDIEATARCLRALGARISLEGNGVRVWPIRKGKGSDWAELDCGESGSTLRFLLPVAAALGIPARFTGHGRLPDRPNAALTDELRRHGAQIDADAPPMAVSGRLTSGRYALPGDISSQYASGLLFALPLLDGESEIAFTTPVESKGYIDMTVGALGEYGVQILATQVGYRVPAPQSYIGGGERTIEGDWSNAAFWLVANAIGSAVDVKGLSGNTAQGDAAIVDLLARFVPGVSDDPVAIDASDVPDLVPALAVRAAYYQGETRIANAGRLRLKESDRLRAMAANLRTLGAQIEETADGLIVRGTRTLRGGCVSSYNDHRIAMAMAIAAAHAYEPVVLTGAEAVAKSDGGFWDAFARLGGNLHVE